MELVQEWDKVFPRSDKVEHRKVTFRTRYGTVLAGDLYVPRGARGKLAALRRSPKASFCVVGRAEILPERFATAYRSVIVFGELREVTEPAVARAAIEGLTAHLAPRASVEAIRAEIARGWGRLRMLALTPTRVSGKWGGLPPED